jgi:hypothetical protein
MPGMAKGGNAVRRKVVMPDVTEGNEAGRDEGSARCVTRVIMLGMTKGGNAGCDERVVMSEMTKGGNARCDKKGGNVR